MGILTLLRNAFGRSRKERAAQAEGATQEAAPPAVEPEPKLPSQPAASPEPAAESAPAEPETSRIPEPRSEPAPDEHDLVKAAFTNVTVPRPTEPTAPTEAKQPPTPAPEPTPASEPETTPEPAATAPHPEATPEPKPEAKAEPEAKPEPEPEPEAKPEPEPEPAPEPAAADGQEAPQGPPAPDNETSTGGAGGNTDAEGEAEAPTTAGPPEAPRGNSDAEGAAEAPKPATTATRLRHRAPALTTAYKAAGTTLKKHGLTGTRARVHLVLDRSASMRPYYKDGSAQALAEQTLALAAHLDPEATVHVTFFSTEVDGTGELTLTGHENRIDELHAALGRMGRTSYHAAVEAVLAHHTENDAPGTPVLVVFQTDGAPDAKTPATQALTKAAQDHPNVHFSFVAFGDPENKAFDYLRKLKTGNASHFLAGETPKELTDKELYEGVLSAWRP
ncbi:VWA domain-containing protein [Streptomyces sp. NRRL F-5650]|uniref:VWA domain-containing protein n=1 Tax=Streptomyces sp. NRRL F-5650 TaxID=1463868 RepID=UPI0004C956D9|nr:VWA domain-containing protein [Streptomyces sp. NRRL F-5650]